MALFDIFWNNFYLLNFKQQKNKYSFRLKSVLVLLLKIHILYLFLLKLMQKTLYLIHILYLFY